MSDLYSEILKSEQMPKSIDDFITEIVEDPTVRDNFLEEFVDEVIDFLIGFNKHLDPKTDSDLLNIRDDMLGLFNKLKYLLTLS